MRRGIVVEVWFLLSEDQKMHIKTNAGKRHDVDEKPSRFLHLHYEGGEKHCIGQG